MAEHNEIGKIGENIAVKYLQDRGFNIIERNFHVKCGEIDIIARNTNVYKKNSKIEVQNLCFIEVKTKKVTSFNKVNDTAFSPEKNLTKHKRRCLLKTIQYYLSFKKVAESEVEIRTMAIIIFLRTDIKQAKIKMYDNFIL